MCVCSVQYWGNIALSIDVEWIRDTAHFTGTPGHLLSNISRFFSRSHFGLEAGKAALFSVYSAQL